MNRTLVCGDIHGSAKAFKQCLERSNFDPVGDTLIQLGDVIDGYNEAYECVDLLLSIPNLIPIRGNHDFNFLRWLETGINSWSDGGLATLESYAKHANLDIWTDLNYNHIDPRHVKFFKTQVTKYIDRERNYLFVHGGFNRREYIRNQTEDFIMWDRRLFDQARSYESSKNKETGMFKNLDEFDEIYIGHTATNNFINKRTNLPYTTPIRAANVYNLDTGAGYQGKLTFMDIDTKEFFQSDYTETL